MDKPLVSSSCLPAIAPPSPLAARPGIRAPNQIACKDLRSEITYELVSSSDSEMNIFPTLLGRGRFAKVYKAWQRSAGHNVRPVAIKILHENIDQRSEQLFLQEISLLKKLTSAAGVNVISVIDILQLGPMVMCGNCGQIYHPRCPRCGEHLLERHDPKHEAFAALRCKDQTRCKYTVSAEHILNSAYALMQYPSKTCCTKDQGARAQRGTLINFVDRDAVVMELLEQGLPHFHDSRRRTYARLCRQHGILLPEPYEGSAESSPMLMATAAAQLNAPQLDTPLLRAAQPAELAYVQKVMLLEKVFLMVQLAESVAWLHGEQQIVHKDLAPDNIMIAALPDPADVDDEWRAMAMGGLPEALTSLAAYPSFSVKVIDFGLADQVQLTRNWYEEPVQNIATEKRPYLSPEALNRKRHIYQRIEFDPTTRRFLVPEVLRPDKDGELSIKPGDLLVDESDPTHGYCLTVTAVEQDAQDRRIFRAVFNGEVPPSSHARQFDLLYPLGEAHDVYALGAIFYFILTGDHSGVAKLVNIIGPLQDKPEPLRAEVLAAKIPSYPLVRDRIPERYFADELMILILRSMIRGLPESFVSSRIERGPEPARKLLQETQRLFNKIKADVLSEPQQRKLEELNASYGHLHRLYGQLRDSHQQQAQNLQGLRTTNDQLQAEKQRAQTKAKRSMQFMSGSMAILLMAGAGGIYKVSTSGKDSKGQVQKHSAGSNDGTHKDLRTGQVTAPHGTAGTSSGGLKKAG